VYVSRGNAVEYDTQYGYLTVFAVVTIGVIAVVLATTVKIFITAAGVHRPWRDGEG